jgi:4-diphosphocytidyl-2C-methyl-D-erythritol kinase
MRVLAPAKINLHLRVGPPTSDGFHPLLSWMVTLGLFDTLTLAHANIAAGKPVLELTCDDPSLPCDQSNLVVRAATALANAIQTKSSAAAISELAPVSATLQKCIPMGAGLGGGSSDGAAILRTLNRFWNAGCDAHALSTLAATLGSDLSFFFHGPSSICTGRGEIVRPIPVPAARWAMLVLPAIHMPTPAVYKRFDLMHLGDPATLRDEPDWELWTHLPANDLLPLLVNDLESPAFAISPDLAALRQAIEQSLGRPVRMSGSGSSLFTLYDRHSDATAAADAVSRAFRQRAIAAELTPNDSDDAPGM